MLFFLSNLGVYEELDLGTRLQRKRAGRKSLFGRRSCLVRLKSAIALQQVRTTSETKAKLEETNTVALEEQKSRKSLKAAPSRPSTRQVSKTGSTFLAELISS